MLTLEEQAIWKLITTNLYFWRHLDNIDNSQPDIDRRSLILAKVRENWEVIKAVAEGKADKSELPSPPATRKSQFDAPPAQDGFDDIPF